MKKKWGSLHHWISLVSDCIEVYGRWWRNGLKPNTSMSSNCWWRNASRTWKNTSELILLTNQTRQVRLIPADDTAATSLTAALTDTSRRERVDKDIRFNLLSEQFCHVLEAFLHQRSDDVDVSGFSIISHRLLYSWHQSGTFLLFRFPGVFQDVSGPVWYAASYKGTTHWIN